MIPKAYVSHRIPNRLRIRIPSERNKAEYFSHLEKELGGLEGVEGIESQPLTSSVLIRHRLPLRALSDYSRSNGLFDLRKARKPEPWSEKIFSKLESMDAELLQATDGQWDLASTAALGIAGISIYRAFQQSFFPPAWTLIADTIRLLARSRRERQKREAA